MSQTEKGYEVLTLSQIEKPRTSQDLRELVSHTQNTREAEIWSTSFPANRFENGQTRIYYDLPEMLRSANLVMDLRLQKLKDWREEKGIPVLSVERAREIAVQESAKSGSHAHKHPLWFPIVVLVVEETGQLLNEDKDDEMEDSSEALQLIASLARKARTAGISLALFTKHQLPIETILERNTLS